LLRRPTSSLLVPVAIALLTAATGSSPGLDEAEVMRVNGTPFIPVGVYDVNGREDALWVREAGLNCAESMLDGISLWAPEAGLRYVRWMIARMKTEAEISALVESGRKDPYNLAWYTFDEPNEVDVSPSQCREVYEIVKDMDPERPVILTVSPAYWYHPWAYSDYADACDVMLTDPYPIEIGHGIGIDYVSEAIERARRDSGKPVWAVLQAFPWPGKRMPTPQEVRCMTYQAIVHGASGVFYYTYRVDGWNYSLTDTPLWGEIGSLAREISGLSGALASSGSEAMVDSGIHFCEKRVGNTTCLIAVNVAQEGRAFEYALPAQVSRVEVAFEGRDLEVSGGILRDSFRAYSTHGGAPSLGPSWGTPPGIRPKGPTLV
jgi:hypothetical protein